MAGTRFEARGNRLINRDRAESMLPGDQSRREVPAQGFGKEALVQFPANGIVAAAGADD